MILAKTVQISLETSQEGTNSMIYLFDILRCWFRYSVVALERLVSQNQLA